jgi:hypothetical protein
MIKKGTGYSNPLAGVGIGKRCHTLAAPLHLPAKPFSVLVVGLSLILNPDNVAV